VTRLKSEIVEALGLELNQPVPASDTRFPRGSRDFTSLRDVDLHGWTAEINADATQATPAGPATAVRAAELKAATKAIKNQERTRTADSL
jgi:hypothetical protein